ncbi:MAG TPA: sodium:solute symporter [Thermoanaerobaculia bacterium]|nr:sodium:solute symporter [Thermoanaerobaculia bacterium]
MGAIDLVIIGGYLACVVGAGLWFGRRQDSTARYFLGGREVPWWAISASIVATETSTITFISVPGIAFARGGDFRFLQLVLGYLAGRIVIAALFIPSYFRGNLVTVYQLLKERFGGKVRSLAASLFVVMRTMADGVRLLLTGIVLAAVIRSFFPAVSVAEATAGSIILLGGVMIVFSFFGGIEAIVWIEVVQFGIYLLGAIAAAVVLIAAIPGGVSAALDLGRGAGKFHLFDWSFDLSRSYTFWAGLIGGCFLTMSTHGTDQFMVQRYLCTESPRKAATALLASGVAVLAQFAGFLFLGVLLFAFYRPDLLPGYATGPAAAPFDASDRVFADFITSHMPPGVSGLVVAAIFAAALSSSLNAIASTFIADLYSPVRPGRPDRHYLRVSKVVTVVAGVIQIVVGLALMQGTRSALDMALAIASLINGPILGVFLLGAIGRREEAAALVGMAAGLLAVMGVWLGTDLAWPWYAAVGSLTTLGVGMIAGRRMVRAGHPRSQPF